MLALEFPKTNTSFLPYFLIPDVTRFIYFFLYIKLQERLIKIQPVPKNKSYLKFKHVSALSI